MAETENWKPIAIGIGSFSAGVIVTLVVLDIIGSNIIAKAIQTSRKDFVYLEAPSVFVPVGMPVPLTVTVVHNSTPSPNVSVVFYVNGNIEGTDTTNSNGQASMIFIPKKKGTYSITAVAGNEPSNTITVIVT